MKVATFNSSSQKDGNTAILLNLVLDELKKEGIETELFQLAGETLSGCIAGYKCAENKDRVNKYIAKMKEAQGILLGSPTYISDMTVSMKAFIEWSTIVSRNNGKKFKPEPSAVPPKKPSKTDRNNYLSEIKQGSSFNHLPII